MFGDQLRLGEREKGAGDPMAAAIGANADPEHRAGAGGSGDEADEDQARSGAVPVEDGEPAALGVVAKGALEQLARPPRRAEVACRGDRIGAEHLRVERDDPDRVRVRVRAQGERG